MPLDMNDYYDFQRNLSINLSTEIKNDEGSKVSDSEALYISGSSLSVNSMNGFMSVPCKESSIYDISETHAQIFGTIPKLEHTESRLPAIELMITDDELETELGLDNKHELIANLRTVFTLTTEEEKYIELKKIQTKISTIKIEKIPPIVIKTYISVLSTYIRHRLTKCVEYVRALTDSKDNDENNIHKVNTKEIDKTIEFSRSNSLRPNKSNSFVNLLKLNLPNEMIQIYHWGFISISLRIIRTFCSVEEYQELVYNENIVKSILSHLDNVSNVLNELKNLTKLSSNVCCKEVSNSLVKSIITFTSNQIANNKKLRQIFMNFMWPSIYFKLYELSKKNNFDVFALLLNNHFSIFFDTSLGKIEGEVEAVRILRKDFNNIYLTNIQANKLNIEPKLRSKFLELYFQILDYLNERAAIKIEARKLEHRDRLGTIVSQTMAEQSVSIDWFSYFHLKFLGITSGRSLYIIMKNLLDYDTEVDSLIISNRIAFILYTINEFSTSTDDEISRIRHISKNKAVDQSVEAKLKRRWNMIKRGFINGLNFNILLNLLNILYNNYLKAIEYEYPVSKKVLSEITMPSEIAVDITNLSNLKYEIVLRPIIKCLIGFLCAPEFFNLISINTVELLITIIRAILIDTSKYYKKYCENKLTNNSEEFIKISQNYSCRDLILIYAVVLQLDRIDLSSNFGDDIQLFKYYQQHQSIDIGCKQAANLIIRLISERIKAK